MPRRRREERFNVFTPPAYARRRIAPGMLIARGTIVGFYDDDDDDDGHAIPLPRRIVHRE